MGSFLLFFTTLSKDGKHASTEKIYDAKNAAYVME